MSPLDYLSAIQIMLQALSDPDIVSFRQIRLVYYPYSSTKLKGNTQLFDRSLSDISPESLVSSLSRVRS